LEWQRATARQSSNGVMAREYDAGDSSDAHNAFIRFGVPGPTPAPPPPIPEDCDESVSGAGDEGYRGCQYKTRGGITCQHWTVTNPHWHQNGPDDRPNKGIGDHNFCRNPDGEPTIWCYTVDSKKRWDYCDPRGYVPTPAPEAPKDGACDETYSGRGNEGYRGCQMQTRSGRTCQKWTDQSPHGHSRTPERYRNKGLGDHNYCRNPDGEPTIWCYTTDRRKRWEYCDALA